MKLISLIIAILLTAALADGAPTVSGALEDGAGGTEQLERNVAASSNVIVTVCLASGDVIVHGWDRAEVHASTADAEQLELQRGAPNSTGPATRVDVIVSNTPGKGDDLTCDCSASSDIQLDVPRGATVQIKTNDGAVEIMDVADVRAETLSGDISVRGVSKRVEASSVSGDVSLENSNGPVRLRSISGSVEASNARTIDATDDCEANTVSGDVILAQISHAHVEARTVSGIVSMKGPLVRGGLYNFRTTSGDMLFTLPDDASFRVSARILQGEIITDFTLKDVGGTTPPVPPAPPKPPAPPAHSARLLTGTHGTGDATLDLYTYSGTVRLRRGSIRQSP
jgi:DUF4097 and DUF4098 domain-containing protein YvlB